MSADTLPETNQYAGRLRKEDWVVKDVLIKDAKAFIERHHYAKGCSHTRVYSHGLYQKDSDILMGVTMWLPPTKVAAQSVNSIWQKVLSLSRLAIHPEVPKNGASFLLARSVALIEKDGKYLSLVTYADERQGHIGRIYRAANWTYIGKMKGSISWVDPMTGKQVSIKATKSRTKQQMLDLGYEPVGVFAKHKYVKHLNTRHT
jgi:hypothetical protein